MIRRCILANTHPRWQHGQRLQGHHIVSRAQAAGAVEHWTWNIAELCWPCHPPRIHDGYRDPKTGSIQRVTRLMLWNAMPYPWQALATFQLTALMRRYMAQYPAYRERAAWAIRKAPRLTYQIYGIAAEHGAEASIRRITMNKAPGWIIRGCKQIREALVCDFCNWERALELAEEMIDNPDYDWVDFDLHDLAETIRDEEHCTPRQLRAIENIYDSGQHPRGM